ncbi:unnamed protein product [Bemisia tabaci]|uniref:Uncharacterized protein n=1 Tax=Bemisia tabaci TaxID=7038 RepID=A0A9P0CAX1_BEMTA|nr:unnamed protein product [Bemisia tabaci]
MSAQKNLDKKDTSVQNITGKLEKSLSIGDGKKDEAKATDAANAQAIAKDKVASKAAKNKKKGSPGEKGSGSTSKPGGSNSNSGGNNPKPVMSYASKLKATSNTPAAPVNPAAGPAPVTTPSSIQDRLQAAQVSAPVVSTNQSLPNAATTFVPSASAQATQNVNPVASVPSSFVPSNPSATSLPTSLTFTNSQQTSFTAPTTNFEDILRKSSLNPDVCDFQPGRPRVVSSQTTVANPSEVEAAVKKLIEDFTQRKNFFKQNLAYYVDNHLKPFLSNAGNIDVLIRTLLNIVLENEDFMYTLVNLLTTCATACSSCDFISQVVSTVKSMSREFNHTDEENNFILVMAYLYQGLAEKYASQSALLSEEFRADIMAMLMTEDLPKVKLALRALQIALGRLEREHSSYFEQEVVAYLSYLSENKSEVRDSIQQVIHYRCLLRQYQDEEALHDELSDNRAQYDYSARSAGRNTR